ncbi:GumC family protein [Kamptonema formosum]|uniref:GumC family protein n=1 Tax=Kamptonema formosum TaxID=331992 RepID=UPI00037AC4D4|nr:hypothetical protein [Oscillatoria sp. PCC 10802]
MSRVLEIPQTSTAIEARRSWLTSGWLYLILGILLNGIIWGGAILAMKKQAPNYTAQWSLHLPPSKSGVNVNLPGVGPASSSGELAGYSQRLDPRDNYQYLANSPSVLSAAARAAGVPAAKFGKPKITLVPNTTIMEFQISGGTPEEAYKKALALNEALIKQVDLLSVKESQRQKEETRAVLRSAQEKFKAAQERLSQYKATSILNNSDQIDKVADNIEELRKERSELLGEQQLAARRQELLSANLGMSPQQAVDALTLQGDQIFQEYLKKYSEASANLVTLIAKWTPASPMVEAERTKQAAARAALMERGNLILAKPVEPEVLDFLTLTVSGGASGERATLFQELITVRGEAQGMMANAEALSQQIAEQETRLKLLTKEQPTLDSLDQEVQVAQAIFTSTVAKLNLSQPETSAAYPPLQMLAEPSLPDAPSGSKKKFILMGAAGASVALTPALVLFWLSKKGMINLFPPEE